MMMALACISYSSMAQGSSNDRNADTDVRERIHFGVKAGLNSSNVYDSQDEEFNTDPKLGLAVGVFVTVPIGRFLGVQPELLFSQKGFKASGQLLGGAYDFKRTTNYIDVPLFVTLKPIPLLTILAGPQYSYLMKRTDEYTVGTTDIVQQEAFENQNLRKNTLCFVGGIDLNIKRIVIGARAGWDLQNNDGDGNSSTPRYKNAWIQGTLGFRI